MNWGGRNNPRLVLCRGERTGTKKKKRRGGGRCWGVGKTTELLSRQQRRLPEKNPRVGGVNGGENGEGEARGNRLRKKAERSASKSKSKQLGGAERPFTKAPEKKLSVMHWGGTSGKTGKKGAHYFSREKAQTRGGGCQRGKNALCTKEYVAGNGR